MELSPKECKKVEAKEMCFEHLDMPIGIAFSTVSLSEYNLNTENLQKTQAYATCLVAFAETYLTAESEWDSVTLNRVMTEGNKHYKNSLAEIQKKDPATVEISESQISKTVILCRNNFDLELFQPFIIGQLISNDPTVPAFSYGCKRFFRKNKYCLLSVGGLHFLIWKRHKLFFLFDPNGRDSNFRRNFQHGYIVVLAFRSFNNVNCYISKLSGLTADELYTIRRIKVTFLLPFIPPNTIYKRIRKTEYEIIDNQHAVLRSHVHLEMHQFAEMHGRLHHVVAMIAILLSKIDQPSTWDSYVVDEVLMLSKEKYFEWINRSSSKELKIQDIPTHINLGSYKIRVEFSFCEMCGTWAYVPNYRFSKLSVALKKLLPNNSNLIVEIAGRFYPLFKRKGYFYLLDSYQHACAFAPAVLHMASSINMICCILHYNVLELLAPTDFTIHKVIIIEIVKKDPKELCLDELTMVYEAKNQEIASLNESIENIQWTLDMKEDQYFCHDDFQDLDSPGISATQVVPDYDKLKIAFDEAEEEDAKEESGAEDDADGDDDDDDGGDANDLEFNIKKPPKAAKKPKGAPSEADSKEDKGKKTKEKKEKAKPEKRDGAKKRTATEGAAAGGRVKKRTVTSDDDEEIGPCDATLPNLYPGYSCIPYNIAVVGSQSGSPESINNLITTAFKLADRVLVMSPWGNYIVFQYEEAFLLYDGCTCNIERFRHLDITQGTAGLICHATMESLVNQIISGSEERDQDQGHEDCAKLLDDLLNQYGN